MKLKEMTQKERHRLSKNLLRGGLFSQGLWCALIDGSIQLKEILESEADINRLSSVIDEIKELNKSLEEKLDLELHLNGLKSILSPFPD